MASRSMLTRLFAICAGLGVGAAVMADDAQPPNDGHTKTISVQALLAQLHAPVDTIKFDNTPLPDALEQISERFQIPISIDESLRKMSPMPKLDLTVSNITVRQLLDVVATCTWTSRWIDPPHYTRETRLRVFWMTRRRADELSEQFSWKSLAVQRAERGIAALSEQTRFEFAGTPFEDALEYFRGFHQVPIEYRGPEQWAERTLTCELEGVPLRDALSLLLQPMELGYVVDNGAIQIVPVEEARKRPLTRVYAVPAWINTDATGRTLEAALVNAVGEGALKVTPHVVWLGSAIVVTAAEDQQARAKKFVDDLRDADAVLVPREALPHPPGKLPPE